MITLLFLMILHLREFCSLWMRGVRKQRVLESDLEIWKIKMNWRWMQKTMIYWSMAYNVKSQGDNCVWKENIIPGYTDRNWYEGSEVAILLLSGILGKTQWNCCIQVGIFGLTWEETEDSKTNKKQLKNYCMKENFNSERIMWRNRDYSTAEGIGELQQCSCVRKQTAGPGGV